MQEDNHFKPWRDLIKNSPQDKISQIKHAELSQRLFEKERQLKEAKQAQSCISQSIFLLESEIKSLRKELGK